MTQSVFCSRCGREMATEAQFCANCGTPRGGGAPAAAAAATTLPGNASPMNMFDVGVGQGPSGNALMDFLMFRRMIIPILIRALFVIALVVCLIGFLVGLFQNNLGLALIFLIVGPFLARLYCELLILLFVLNDTATDSRRILQEIRDIERSRAQ